MENVELILAVALVLIVIDRVNYRKEFFCLSIDRLRAAAANRAVDVSFTMVAEAREYRESKALSKMNPTEQGRFKDVAMAMDTE
jgi:hypothetical protein